MILILVPEGVCFGAVENMKAQERHILDASLVGCPVTWDKTPSATLSNMNMLSDSETSEDSLKDFYQETGVQQHAPRTSDTTSPVCLLKAATQTQLMEHLKGFHTDSWPFACMHCDKSFNNRVKERAHVRMVHAVPCFSCCCAFTAACRSKIRKHARVHSDWKFNCAHCTTRLSSKDALAEHLKHHLDTKVYPCISCGKQFSSALACQIHFKGKHGDGYPCKNCGTRFDAPIQRCRHMKKCSLQVNALAGRNCRWVQLERWERVVWGTPLCGAVTGQGDDKRFCF